MALPTIAEMALSRIKLDGIDSDIELNTRVAMYDVQRFTLLDNAVVELEESYTHEQRTALAVYVAYLSLAAHVVNSSASVSTSSVSTSGTQGASPFLSKAKVDVLEVEFDNSRGTPASANTAIGTRAKQTTHLLDQLRQEACVRASAQGWTLPICGILNEGEQWIPSQAPVTPIFFNE